MAEECNEARLPEFLRTGIYRFDPVNAVFLDPVRILNKSYSRFRVSPSAYYSRFFTDADPPGDAEVELHLRKSTASARPRKRKRKQKKPRPLNDREQLADFRHQEARPLLARAHEALLSARELLEVMPDLRGGGSQCQQMCIKSVDSGYSFINLGKIWQAPLYEITLKCSKRDVGAGDGGARTLDDDEHIEVPLFNNLVSNITNEELEAEFLGVQYIIPRQSCFYMSGLEKIHELIPGYSDCGFNLIMVDPPWENRSVHQKSSYPTLPNRYFLALPIKQLAHAEGALVGLWVTNREKLRSFVENELFPAWGVTYITTYYWIKVKSDGSLICELDLFHHRPYECLLLGYVTGKVIDRGCLFTTKHLKDDLVIVSIPGDYSRKPPVGELLLEYAPGPRPARCIELFAREMIGGWTFWGNEPLHFQRAEYFLEEGRNVVVVP